MTKKTWSLLQYSSCIVAPGYIAVCQEPALVGVVCGNGIAIFLRDKIRHVSGVAHYIFPQSRSGQPVSNYCAETAIKSVVRCMIDNKACMSNIEAQIYGGGNLRGFAKERAEKSLAETRKVLGRMKIKIVSEDIGGTLGRKILFNTYTGEAMVWKTNRVRQTDWAPEMLERYYHADRRITDNE